MKDNLCSPSVSLSVCLISHLGGRSLQPTINSSTFYSRAYVHAYATDAASTTMEKT